MAVNLSPLGGAGAQFFTDNGVPLTAGLIYTYQAGSSTPQPTYTSSSGVTLHSNPIVLDSAGRVPGGEIWLTDGVDYKFVLNDSDDVLIATYDNIPSLSTTIDAANVTYTAPYTAATQETLRNKLAQIVSVKDFGATGDGLTDDTVAIQNAIDGLGVGILYFPAGTYKVTAGLTVDTSMILRGDSPNSSLIKPYGNIDVFTFGGMAFASSPVAGSLTEYIFPSNENWTQINDGEVPSWTDVLLPTTIVDSATFAGSTFAGASSAGAETQKISPAAGVWTEINDASTPNWTEVVT